MKVYLDYAATTPLDKRVLAKMTPYMTDVFANPSSSHFYGRESLAGLDEARDRVAELLHAAPSEIYFTASGSEADSWALKGFARALGKNCGKILVSAIEHHAVLNAARALQREGFSVGFLPVTSAGIIDLSALQAALTERVSLVCVMAANNEVGTWQPIDEIATLARGAGATLFTDCVQAALYSDINVKNSGMGMLSLSSHKFYGPKGMGVLYIKKGVPMSALINGGEQERGLRGGTSNTAGAAGFAEAFSLACAEREENAFRVKALRDRFLECILSDIPNTALNGDKEKCVPCNANISFVGANGTALLHRLDLNGIAASAGSACASGAIEPSHVLQAMGLSPERTESAIRFTFGKYNTLDEVDYTVKILRSCVKELRVK
jgi:cysteine desulfurase